MSTRYVEPKVACRICCVTDKWHCKCGAKTPQQTRCTCGAERTYGVGRSTGGHSPFCDALKPAPSPWNERRLT